jgi:hypothetical protein
VGLKVFSIIRKELLRGEIICHQSFYQSFSKKEKNLQKQTNKQTNSLDGGLKNSVSFLGLKAHKAGLNRLFYQYYFLIELRKRY